MPLFARKMFTGGWTGTSELRGHDSHLNVHVDKRQSDTNLLQLLGVEVFKKGGGEAGRKAQRSASGVGAAEDLSW